MLRLRDTVFVLGAPRCGTTFLGRWIGAHPGFSYCHEPLLPKSLVGLVYRGSLGARGAKAVFAISYALHLGTHGALRKRLVEKTPRNCTIARFLARAFDRSQFIHIVRDGRDAAASHLRTPWLADETASAPTWHPHRYVYGPHARFWVEPSRRDQFERSSQIRRIAWEWRRYNELTLALDRALPGRRYLRVHYEDFSQRPDVTVRALTEYLDLCSGRLQEKGCLKAPIFNPRSIGRWRRDLCTQDVAEYEREAGGLLQRLGYALAHSSVRPAEHRGG